ncbi:MAG: FkbM family methyltransferase [Chitinophagia bacterium]|nr:FkbM family methyltransferase [Chitinophagia bacterium]
MAIDSLFAPEALAQAKDNLDNIRKMLDDYPVIIFGSGNLGKKLAKKLAQQGVKVSCFSDNNPAKWGTIVEGLTILSPAQTFEEYGSKALCVVGIWSPGHSYQQTQQQLADLGFEHIAPSAALMQLFPEQLLPHYHFQTPEYFAAHADEISAVYHALADAESKAQYLSHIRCRIMLDFEHLPQADIIHQYFPEDIPQLGTNEVFFDAGAFTGDTLRDFIKYTDNQYKKYIALEPDPANYERLQQTIESEGISNVTVYKYAVGARRELLKFNATGGGGAGLAADGEIEVECVTIDEQFVNEPMTYLKFDIEGAELDALKGAENYINKYRPRLAVCIYHLPDDIWTIPLYIKKQFPFYQLFARTHQYDGLDFVLYALPL